MSRETVMENHEMVMESQEIAQESSLNLYFAESV